MAAALGLALWGTEPAASLAAAAADAEAVGFESVWVIDSQLLCREAYVTLAACLARTGRLRVATGVTQPVTRHPSVTASGIATLDELAPGRVMMGIGTGFSSLGTIGRPAARIADLERYVARVRTLLGGGAVTFDGGVEGRLDWLARPALVPIHLAASGPRMTRAAGRSGDGAILLQGIAPEFVDRAIAWVDEGAVAAGRPPGSVQVSCWVPFSLDTDPTQALDRARSRVAGAVAKADAGWFEGEERAAAEAVQRAYVVEDHARATAPHAALVPDSIVRKFAVAGDAASVRAQLRALRAHPRVGRVILTPQVSGEGALPLTAVVRAFGEAGLAEG